MPSIKSCIASLAVLAMTIAPVVNAGGVHADALAGRDMHANNARAVSSPSVNLDKRAAAKAAAAARALARREAKAEAARTPLKAGAGASSTTVTVSSYNAGSAFVTAALAMTGGPRCGYDTACQAQYTSANGKIPQGATAFCVSSQCTYRCNSGLTPMSDGSCGAPITQCGTTTCPSVTSGYVTCSTTNPNVCTPTCYTGYHLYVSNGQYACYDTLNDAAHCGPVAARRLRQCTAASYNGVGTPACVFGSCTLSCPAGQNAYKSSSTTRPYYCA